jgi:hypothetical protein
MMSRFITVKEPPRNRVGKHRGSGEHHLTEMAVMLAVGEWLFKSGAREVTIHPDGMHLHGFDVPSWCVNRQFEQTAARGTTNVGGTYRRGQETLILYPRPGLGDVTATLNGVPVEVETKGGCINTTHSGQISRLRRGLFEAVGQLMSSPREGTRLIAAVPNHAETQKVAHRMAARCAAVGIEIALVDCEGNVSLMGTH